jgi:hypothetical protein
VPEQAREESKLANAWPFPRVAARPGSSRRGAPACRSLGLSSPPKRKHRQRARIATKDSSHGAFGWRAWSILDAVRTRSGLKLLTPTAEVSPALAQSARPRTKASLKKPLVMKPGQWI